MLVMLRRHGAGFLGVTDLSGERGLVMLSGQRHLRLSVSGFSLLKSKSFLNSLKDALFLFLEASRVKIFCVTIFAD